MTARMRKQEHAQSSGFTLVEVLAALTLAAVVLPVAMQGVSLSLAAAGQANRQMVAATLAEGMLAELTATGEWRSGNLSGDFGGEAPAYRWEAESVTWEVGRLRLLEVSVFWTSAGRERSLTLTTLVREGGD